MIRVYFGKAGSVECVCHEYGDGYPCGPHLCCQHNGQSQSSPCVITRARATWDAIRAAHIKKCELDRLTNANCGVTV